MDRRAFTIGFSGAVAGVLAGCLGGTSPSGNEEREENRTYEAGSGIELRIRNENGPVTVRTFDGDGIEVDIVVSGPSTEALDAVSVTDERTDDTLLLKTEYGSAAAEASASLTVRYPETVNTGSVRTSNASVEVDVPRIDGDTEIATSNGGIDAALARGLDAAVTATTTNGSVEVTGLDLDSVEQSDTNLSGSLGDGTYTLSLETKNASIDLQALSE